MGVQGVGLNRRVKSNHEKTGGLLIGDLSLPPQAVCAHVNMNGCGVVLQEVDTNPLVIQWDKKKIL